MQDDEGQSFPDLEAACGHARQVAEQFWADLSASVVREAVTIEVTDESGQEFTTVRFHADTELVRSPSIS
ncbi:hypothetical protein AA309_26395 [Microvirga vignae]|uniref:DUF6894 domain-containing protein n=2 Tax=Microvirga vignae TaxID=1225564 RepID=A0A0H1R5L2_9HYPH|nr:hypothetical protein AA309_26395 [Microvirga vignae]